MKEGFFDENILKQENTNNSEDINFKDLEFHIKKDDKFYQIYLQSVEMRLNSSEISTILKENEEKNFLNSSDTALLTYLSSRLGYVQTIYKIISDFSLILSYLKDSNFKIFFEEKEVSFSKKEFKLNFQVKFDENSNIVLDIKDQGEFLFTSDRAYFLTESIFYPLSDKLNLKFYEQLSNKNNKFSIESFLALKETILIKIKENHNLNLNKELESLSLEKLDKRVADIILEIGKTNHFIILNFKYKIGSEYYRIEDYSYHETQNWVNAQMRIKIVKENDNLVEYLSNQDFSEEVFNDLFESSKIRISLNQKNPFTLMLPISYLDLFVDRVLPKAEKMFKVEYKGGEKLKLEKGEVSFELETNLQTKFDLFEFKVKFRLGDEFFDLDYLKELILKPKKYVQLKNGTTINVENIREINKWIDFLDRYEFQKKDNTYKVASHTALELDEFLKDFKNKNINSNQEYKNVILELKEKKPISRVEIPKEVDSILRKYQKEGVYWLYFLQKYNFGGILADEMGLGKTIQTLSILAMNNKDIHLVVCPKSLIYNWENEIKKYFPNMRVLVVDKDSDKRKELIKKARDYDVLITSYSMLQKDYREYYDNNIEFNYMVLDEAHYVKNMKTLSAKAVRIIHCKRRILLTGTPLENNLEELYGTLDLVMPGYLGSLLDFKREFVSKIERNNMIVLESLQSKIRPFILRRTKKEVLKELPDKQEQIVFNEMTNKQIAIYNEVLNRVKFEINSLVEKQGFDKSRIQVLSALLKLRQICNHPSLLDDTFKGEEGISGKYEQFIELLEEVLVSKDKVLVFSQFTSMLDILENNLKNKKIEYLRLDGLTKNRQEIVDRFNEDEKVRVFLISLKAGGVGLNLTSASAVFLYDPWWNPMAEQQAVDRAHRIGQKKKVNIYKFITKNSIEEKILKLQERKGNMFENLVSSDTSFMKKLEWEDLMELFE
jgi:superfamily II DNA or RNA helicase/predicted DNA-binding antitoxin AbrB/MazE fold protein